MREIADQRNAGFTGSIVLEAPILVEAKGTGLVDQIWVVAAPAAAVRRGSRARAHDASRDRRARRGPADDAERRRHADVIIENDGDLLSLRQVVEAAWRTVVAS